MDIRLPVGAIFAIYGVLLIVWGVVSGDVAPHHMIGVLNVNVWAGIGMLIFGGWFLMLTRRGGPTVRRAMSTPEGRATEDFEKRTGRERH